MARLRFFSVRGNGSFPFEMLYIDSCFPSSLADAEQIALACPTVAPEQTIMLASHALDPPSIRVWEEKKWPIKYVGG
jgi:hypothetical protein